MTRKSYLGIRACRNKELVLLAQLALPCVAVLQYVVTFELCPLSLIKAIIFVSFLTVLSTAPKTVPGTKCPEVAVNLIRLGLGHIIYPLSLLKNIQDSLANLKSHQESLLPWARVGWEAEA